jgi:6-pyruvoyl-tetrahydropterin synthase
MPLTAITIGGDGAFAFSAAHTGIHDGAFEPLHGHSFTVTLCLHGDLDSAGMLVDFSIVKRELAAVIAPLRRRTLMPARHCRTEDAQVIAECGPRRYSLPAGDVVQLPVESTTTEAIAGWLLAQLIPRLPACAICSAALTLAEAADTSATVTVRF